jgi:hypothetical protein
MLRSAKWAEFLAVLDDSSSQAKAYTRQGFQFAGRGSVDID